MIDNNKPFHPLSKKDYYKVTGSVGMKIKVFVITISEDYYASVLDGSTKVKVISKPKLTLFNRIKKVFNLNYTYTYKVKIIK